MHLIPRSVTRSAALSCAVVLGALVAAAPAAPVAAAGCKVTNVATTKSKATLQEAVDAAKNRQTLQVRGTCTGSTTIAKNLTIVGVTTKATGKPVLVGPGTGRVLLVSPGAAVTILNLAVRGGDVSAEGGYPGYSGGGIRNEGTLTLRNVVVSGNKAGQGGGITTTGRLTLAGTTRLSGNEAKIGGGLDVEGDATTTPAILTDKARINGNTTTQDGGGIYAYKGRITMMGRSQVDHNESALNGGGAALNQTTLTLKGLASIHDNTAAGGGGAINANISTLKLTGDSRLHHNTSAGDGGAINGSVTTLVMRDRAQIDHNESTAKSAGAVELWPGDVTMSGSSSIHHNTANYAGGVELYATDSHENSMVMNDTSSVYANVAKDATGVMGISVVGNLTMNDKSVVRSHVSTTVKRVVEIYNYKPEASLEIKMTGQSRIRSNKVAAGMGALSLYPDCGAPITQTGTASRVVNNVTNPGGVAANIFTAVGC